MKTAIQRTHGKCEDAPDHGVTSGELLHVFLLGLTDIADPVFILPDADPARLPDIPRTPPAQDRNRLAGDWKRVGRHLSDSMAAQESHG